MKRGQPIPPLPGWMQHRGSVRGREWRANCPFCFYTSPWLLSWQEGLAYGKRHYREYHYDPDQDDDQDPRD